MPLSLFYTKCIPHRRTMCRTLLAWQGVRAQGKRGVSGDSSWKEQVSEEISGQEKAQARCANQKNIPTKTNRPPDLSTKTSSPWLSNKDSVNQLAMCRELRPAIVP